MSRTIAKGYSSFEVVVVPETDSGGATGYLWTHRFSVAGGGSGAVALGDAGDWTGAGRGKVALFALSHARIDPEQRVPLGPGETAWTARIPFEWKVGGQYELQVWTDRRGGWSALVREYSGDDRSIIGQVQMPDSWRGLESSSMTSTEYHGTPIVSCEQLPPSSVLFGTPTAEGGNVVPEQSQNRIGTGNCEGSHVEPVSGGVRHRIGGPARRR